MLSDRSTAVAWFDLSSAAGAPHGAGQHPSQRNGRQRGRREHIHDDVEHLSKDLQTLTEKAGLDQNELPGLSDLKDHLKDLDAHAHDVLSHVGHVAVETGQ